MSLVNLVILPTIGRRVLVFAPAMPGVQCNAPDVPFDAGIAYVHSAGYNYPIDPVAPASMINVSFADHNGVAHSQTSVPLYDRAQTPQDAHGKEWYAVWMEYQFNQALRALQPTQAPQVGAGRPVDVQLRQLPEGA